MATKEKFEEAKRLYETANADQRYVLESLFPELKESEDEKIRKGIIRNLEYLMDRAEGFVKDELKERIAWLEKLKVFAEHGDGLYYFGNNGFTYVGNPTCDNVSRIERQVEQKPAAWSEEDENRINRLILYFEDKESFTAEDDVVYANWLKSLKERYTWKPSDEQMQALDDFIYAKYPNIEKYGAAVKSLYQDLKKLKG